MAPARRCRAAPHAPMTTFLLILLVLLMAAAVFYLARLSQSQKRQLTDLRAEEEAIVAEERRLFGFLHDLGHRSPAIEGQSWGGAQFLPPRGHFTGGGRARPHLHRAKKRAGA